MSDLQLKRRAMRSSLDAIPKRPPPTLQQLSSNKSNCKMMKTKTKELKLEETEVVNDSICNSFRFVVNYGYFEPYYEWMPNEILSFIFGFLNTQDLMSVSRVCKNWLEATQYFKLTRKFLLHFQVFSFSDNAYPISRFLTCSRYFPNIKFTNVKFSPHNDTFWMDYGEIVESLSLNSCVINKPEFLRILRSTPHLQSLEVIQCDDLYKSWTIPKKKLSQPKFQLPYLTELKIQGTSMMTTEIFESMISLLPNIKSLTLDNCFHESTVKERVQFLNTLIRFVRNQALQLTSLNLIQTPVDEIFLEQLSMVIDLKLKEFHLTFNGTISPKSGMTVLLQKQINLQVLDLTDSKGLNNSCMIEICKNMPNLKKLILNKCWQINDGGLREINNLTKLEILNINSCDRVTDYGIDCCLGLSSNGGNGKKLLQIKELHLGVLPYMSVATTNQISQHYNQLELLDLSGSSNSITDTVLQMIFKHQTKLKHLNLDCCAKISDNGITGGVGNEEQENEENENESNLRTSINNLKDLQFLNIAGCYQVTDKSLSRSFCLANCKEINFAKCHNLTQAGLEQVCKKCPALECIDLSECFINDSTVEMISRKALRLEILKLNGTQITDESLKSIQNNCNHLKVLFIRRCPQLIDNPTKVLKNVRFIHNQ